VETQADRWGYTLSPAQAKRVAAQPIVTEVTGDAAPWHGVDHNLSEDGKTVVPSIFVCKNNRSIGEHLRRLTSPRDGNFLLFLMGMKQVSSARGKDVLRNIMSDIINNHDLVCITIAAVFASLSSALWMGFNLTGRDLFGLVYDAPGTPLTVTSIGVDVFQRPVDSLSQSTDCDLYYATEASCGQRDWVLIARYTIRQSHDTRPDSASSAPANGTGPNAGQCY